MFSAARHTIEERPARRPLRAAGHLRLVAPRTLRVLVADDLELDRAGLRALLEGEDDIAVVGEATHADQASAQARGLHPDVVVLDLGHVERHALEAAWAIVTDPELTDTGVLILTRPDDRGGDAPVGRRGSACRFLAKDSSPAALVAAVRELAARPSICPNPRQEARSWNSVT
jgi:DNA-binding NarL/FixJ family response regulator